MNKIAFVIKNNYLGKWECEQSYIPDELVAEIVSHFTEVAPKQSVQRTAKHVHEFTTSGVCACGVTRKQVIEHRRASSASR